MRRSRRSFSKLEQREVSFSSLTTLLARDWPTLWRSPSPILDLEDRRAFHPLGDYRPARQFGNRFKAGVALKRSTGVVSSVVSLPRDRFRFDQPQRVAVCVRRHTRREVLAAMGKFTSGRGKPRRRNYYSDVEC